MKVLIARTSGFCDGVRRAMRIALEGAARHGGLDADGPLVHNDQALELLALHGIAYDIEWQCSGQPHHILRHPDMPKVAFKGLWDTILSGQKWHGYVKNLRKDGAYYWVYATALPNVRKDEVVGFTSVRRKPSRKRIEELIPVYRQWLEEERNAAGLATEQAP